MNFTFSETREPGTYKPVLDGNRRTAIVVCPRCGSRLHLSPHLVLNDGTVTPSVVCRSSCTFHEFITLDGWSSE